MPPSAFLQEWTMTKGETEKGRDFIVISLTRTTTVQFMGKDEIYWGRMRKLQLLWGEVSEVFALQNLISRCKKLSP